VDVQENNLIEQANVLLLVDLVVDCSIVGLQRIVDIVVIIRDFH
jgi:hypothetical protein